jgi:DNA polymerase-3 subunit gamma/tau
VRSSDSTLTLSVPNAVHRRKCEEQRSTVEAALGAHVGRPVTLELLDGGGGGRDDRGGRDDADTDDAVTGGSRERGQAVTSEATGAVDPSADVEPRDRGPVELPDDDEVDLDDLVDAPPETVKSPIDRLAEAFPGSELIEEAG